MNTINTVGRPEKDRGFDVEFLQPGTNYRPDWGRRSEEFRKTAAATSKLDVSYGHGPRGHLDFFPAANAAQAPTLIFLHGGYWQRGDKSFYSFVAKPFVERGVSCILLNYDFCPSVRITEIGLQIQAAVRWIWRNSAELGIARDKLHISGHSAGAHLSAMMITTDWPALEQGLPADLLKSAGLVSGLYHLTPLLQEAANSQLQLDETEARAQSPVQRRSTTDAPQLVAYGEQESDTFHEQSQMYARAFQDSSKALELYEVPGSHHFEIMNVYADPDSELFAKSLALIKP